MNGSNITGGLLITLVILVVIFLVLREFFCWYWKINERLALLKDIRDHLATQNASTGRVSAAQVAPSDARDTASLAETSERRDQAAREDAVRPKGQCPSCDAVIPLDVQKCPKCKALFGQGSAWKIKPLS